MAVLGLAALGLTGHAPQSAISQALAALGLTGKSSATSAVGTPTAANSVAATQDSDPGLNGEVGDDSATPDTATPDSGATGGVGYIALS